MLDMSKAFDTVNRKLLIEDLPKIINRDELHIISIMLQVELSVKCGSSTSEFFKTDTGVPQGDGLSANQFTLYLANTLKNIQRNENDYAIQQPLTLAQIISEHCYTKPINDEINIVQEYADDMSSITTNPTIIEYKKKNLPANLEINETKTEEYEIKRKGNVEWKECKFLGSLINTEEDIKRRKALAIAAINKMHHIFYDKIDKKSKYEPSTAM